MDGWIGVLRGYASGVKACTIKGHGMDGWGGVPPSYFSLMGIVRIGKKG